MYVYNATFIVYNVQSLVLVSHLHDTPLYSVPSSARLCDLAPKAAYIWEKVILQLNH